jgi:hypothetical protein
MAEAIRGSCLCGAIRFELKPPLTGFRYCHCSRCRKATGGAHAANGFLPAAQFTWLAGEALLKRFDLPGAQRFAVWFCPHCGTRMPHRIKTTENMLIPAGVLDDDPGILPQHSIFWKSKAQWYVPPADLQKFDEYS